MLLNILEHTDHPQRIIQSNMSVVPRLRNCGLDLPGHLVWFGFFVIFHHSIVSSLEVCYCLYCTKDVALDLLNRHLVSSC